ncbi:hypothetical protein NEAUS07_2073 [Nematocida ausubeli]|nr:hypothetical protein NEAUS07_2073 [Nematocida ausubeli]
MKNAELKQLRKKSFSNLHIMIRKILLILAMARSVLTRVNMEDIKTVSETLVGKAQDVVINPKGPLNLQRGYIGHRSRYMYNKRFYSSEIDTDYLLKKDKISRFGQQEYTFARTPVNDRSYKELDTKSSREKYLSTYHTQLIKMFPSIDGDLSIEAGRPNALTNFLRADHVKKDTKYILAALLLLSEGIDIKIAVDHTEGNKKKLVIKSKKYEEKVFVNVEMHTTGIDPVTNEHSESIYQSEAAEIVNFYRRCRDNPLLKKGGEFAMPSCKKEFESGNFLNSAAFLIQTYIYEFIDTAEDYKDFVEAAHELMGDQVVEKENPEQTKKKGKKGRIFDELFLAKDALGENIKYIESFCDLIQAKNEDAKFPFCNDSQLPQYTRVPRYKKDKSGFELDQSFYYSDCVETALLGLFCCLAYNPETGKYETCHMGKGVSKELRDFFEKYPKPTEATDFEMHKQWSRVVACLDNHEIDYKKEKNELIAGVGNILLAISEITGQKKEILKLVESIKAACKAGEFDNMQKFYIKNKIESIIKSLSLNKNVRVECNQMALGQRSNGKADLLAEIKIIYVFDGAENGIVLKVTKGHGILTLLSSLDANSAYIIEKCEEVKNTYNGIESYIEYIVVRYIDAELNDLRSISCMPSNDLIKSIDPILQDMPNNISKIFLFGKLANTSIKAHIIKLFIVSTINNELDPTNPAARFTANILGSVPLNDSLTRRQMMKFFPIHPKWQEYYPKLGYKPSEHLPETEIIHLSSSEIYFSNLLISCPVPTTIKAIGNYFKATMDYRKMHYMARYFMSSKSVFNHIASEGLDSLVKIQSILNETKDFYILNFVYTSWLFHICTGNCEFTPDLIKTVYNFILFDHLQDISDFKELGISSVGFRKCVSFLKKRKSLLCTKNDKKSIKNYDKLILYFKFAIKRKSFFCLW